MQEEAKKQFLPITVGQVKDVLKKITPDRFDKMIIQDGQGLKRGNYIFAKMKYQEISRQGEKVKFPLFGSVKDNFRELEGGNARFGQKARMNFDRILEVLQSRHSISPQNIDYIDANQPFEFPIENANGEVLTRQERYFFPDLTYQETCEECNGHKYITCQDHTCNGRHKWTCTECHGDGRLTCNGCAGRSWVDCSTCNGSNKVRCKKCGGDGKVNDGFIAKTVDSKYAQVKRCGECAGNGRTNCRDCSSGRVTCRKCSGNGKVTCSECDAAGSITCSKCYGDKERYGKINCPVCKTEGITAQIVYVSTLVATKDFQKFIVEGDKIRLNENDLMKHVKSHANLALVYKNVDGSVASNHDDFSEGYTDNFERELNLNKHSFPMITKEEVSYQVLPCVEISYKHMLTNTIHELTIIDFWDNPEVFYHSEPEELKQNLSNATKAVGGFFGKLFKTKGFKTKEDKRNEIVLLIHLAKVDGKIEEQEKSYLAEMIGSLDDFTNSEKQKLFDIMNSAILPELTKADVTFSSKDRAEEVLNKLIELANSDGEMETAERMLIDKIKSMI